jgi:hypothetical protein
MEGKPREMLDKMINYEAEKDVRSALKCGWSEIDILGLRELVDFGPSI